MFDESSVTTVERCLGRVAQYNDRLRAMIKVLDDEALLSARRGDEAARRGEALGLLHGWPVAVKDVIDVAGLPTTRGLPDPGSRVAVEDAECVRRLREAGAIILGKTNLDPVAFAGTGDNPTFGRCSNPWNPDYSSGGSSGGSAVAVAAGMCRASLGTDSGGSVLIPAAFNGVTGLRPTVGRIPLAGVFGGLHFTVVGLFAKSAIEVAQVLAATGGYLPDDPLSSKDFGAFDLFVSHAGEPSFSVGVPHNFFFDSLNDEIRASISQAIDVLVRAGGNVVSVELPGAERAHEAFEHIHYADIAALCACEIADQPDQFPSEMLGRLVQGQRTLATTYSDALRWLAGWRRTVELALDRVDVIVSPVLPVEVPRHAESSATQHQSITEFTFAWVMAPVTVLSVPCGFHESGLPVGMLLISRMGSESLLLRLGASYQAATDWHLRMPPMV